MFSILKNIFKKITINNRRLSWGLFALTLSTQAQVIDFDQSMKTAQFSHVLKQFNGEKLLAYLRFIYKKNNPDAFEPSHQTRIPKIIHQIWLGQKMPEEYVPYKASWMQYHPEWTFIFWADNPINFEQELPVITSFEALKEWLKKIPKHGRACVVDVRSLRFDNRGFYDAAHNYGEKSDILKWEIVYRFGGLYVDTDFECLRPLDYFNHVYDFYTGIQPLDTNRVQLGAALYAAVPGHPVLKRCVEQIKNNQHLHQIVLKTGPLHFTACFVAEAHKHTLRDVALPAGYFYPCGYDQKGMDRSVWERPESYAVHHWAGSWLKPEGFEKV